MIGIMTEKPSQARNFAKALGGMQGTYNGEQYKIVSARGHLYEFKDPTEQVSKNLVDKYKSWDVNNLPWKESDFAWKRQRNTYMTGTASLLKGLKNDLKGCSELVIGGDVDPSGEGTLIQVEIIEELGLYPQKVSRMYFEDESEKEITNAFRNRKTVNLRNFGEYDKAFFRARWDFLSMQFTRAATKISGSREVIRQGRLKSAMLVLVGDQFEKVNNYKKIPFYENRFKDENGNVYSSVNEEPVPNQNDLKHILNSSEVVSQGKTRKKSVPPKLYNLSTLTSKLVANYKDTYITNIYQKMYEANVVSYPRTEDKGVTPEQFSELLGNVDKIAKVVGIDSSLLTHRTPRTTHVKDGQAHGANRPGKVVPSSLSELDAKFGKGASEIYKLLAYSALAMFAEDYEYDVENGYLKDYPDFKGSCSIPVKSGWKAILGDEPVDSGKGLGRIAKPFVYEGFPPKPQLPTYSWLMNQLDKYDVGTGATRVATFAEISNSKSKGMQFENKKGKISFTPVGEIAYVMAKDTNIGSLDITKELTKQMKDVEKGANPKTYLDDMERLVREDIEKMIENSKNIKNVGGAKMADFEEKEKVKGLYKGQKEIKFNREWGGHRFTDAEIEQLLDGEDVLLEDLTSKAGKPYSVSGKLEEQEFKGHKFWGFKADFGNK